MDDQRLPDRPNERPAFVRVVPCIPSELDPSTLSFWTYFNKVATQLRPTSVIVKTRRVKLGKNGVSTPHSLNHIAPELRPEVRSEVIFARDCHVALRVYKSYLLARSIAKTAIMKSLAYCVEQTEQATIPRHENRTRCAVASSNVACMERNEILPRLHYAALALHLRG